MLPVFPRRVFFRAHPCWVRLGRAMLWAGVWFGAFHEASAQGLIPLGPLLAEADLATKAERPLDAASALERVITEVGRGASLPGGLSLEQVRVAAASAAFRGGDVVRAEALARQITGPSVSAAALAEGRLVLGLSLAQQKRYADAMPVFSALAEAMTWRDQALLYLALAAESAGDLDAAINAYGRLLALASPDADWADAGLAVVALHLKREDPEAAHAVLRELGAAEAVVDNLVALDALRLDVAERLSAAGDTEGAVRLLETVKSRAALLARQRERVSRLEALMAVSPRVFATVAETDRARRGRQRYERVRAAMTALETTADYDAVVAMRRAGAFYASGGLWEAALVLERLLADAPDAACGESAERLRVQAYAEAGRYERAKAAFDAMHTRRGESEPTAQALYALAQACQVQGRLAEVAELLDLGVERFPRSPLRETMWVMRINALFGLARFAEARGEADRALAAYPEGALGEDAFYLRCMAGLVLGEHARALGELDDYQRRFPNGRYGDDAAYRVAAALYAQQAFAEAEQRARGWLAERAGDHPQRGEVLSLLGDILAARSRPEEALQAYREALEAGLPDEPLGYVLDEATKLYQARGDNVGAAEMWEAFATARPSHPFVVNAAYWIGRLRTRAGKPDEAVRRMAEIARTQLEEAGNDGMERLLSELARLLVAVPDAEIEARVDQLLFAGGVPGAPTAEARRCFLLAQRAAAKRQTALEGEWLDRILALEAMDSLPPALLGRLGDRLRERGEAGRARRHYEHLLKVYPRSVYADFGQVGLGDLALAEGETARALKRFDEAIDRAGARHKLLEATLGRGRALFALGRLDEAEAVFRQVSASREWRGEPTVTSLLCLGEIAVRRGTRNDLAQAQAHFQRVYLTYRKFTPQVGRAYLRSAEVFEQLGQRSEALATYRELLRDERLAALPEAGVARERVARAEANGT